VKHRLRFLFAPGIAFLLFVCAPVNADQGKTTRISITNTGEENNGDDLDPAVSQTGKYVTYYSGADNIVAGDTNGAFDVFVVDLDAGWTERVSISSSGEQANNNSFLPSVSADGQFIAFTTWATNLVPDDANDRDDIMVHDRSSGRTIRVSVSSDGIEANGSSYYPEISLDGKTVVFESRASNLVPGDATGSGALGEELRDTFVHNRVTGRTLRLSLSSDNAQGNGSSYLPKQNGVGSLVAFDSAARNLVALDTNDSRDVFYRNRATQQTILVSRNADMEQGGSLSFDPAPSADGRYIAFSSLSENLVANDSNGKVDIFLYDVATETITRVSTAYDGGATDGDSMMPVASATGRYIAFQSWATNLVPGDDNEVADVFVYDSVLNTTTRVSVDTMGIEGNRGSYEPSLTPNGRYVVFYSEADNLVSGDTNGKTDIFLHDYLGSPERSPR
jgi:Tol biopolymer transport system component